MKKEDAIVSVGLYLRGENLNPDLISKKLGVFPTESQFKGEEKLTSTNHKFTTKIGMWALISEIDSNILSEHVNQLSGKIKHKCHVLRELPDVVEAYFDVFIALDTDKDGECVYEFKFEKHDIADLEQIGLPIHFKFTAGPP